MRYGLFYLPSSLPSSREDGSARLRAVVEQAGYAEQLGFDSIWFGVMSMMMVAMGLVFPPVGLIAFIVSATAGVDLMKVYKGTSILMLSIVITTVLLMIFPQIALWLPATMR